MNANDPASLTLDELRKLRNRLQDEDDDVSYVRRVAQARIDLVQAELGRRERGETSDDVSAELRVVLSSHLTGGTPRPPRPVDHSSDNESSDELDAVCAQHGYSRFNVLDAEALRQLIEELATFEQKISANRRARFDELDALSAELVRRYKDGGASVDGLFAD